MPDSGDTVSAQPEFSVVLARRPADGSPAPATEDVTPVTLPFSRPSAAIAAGDYAALPIAVPQTSDDAQLSELDAPSARDLLVAAFAAYLARLSGQSRFDLVLSEGDLRNCGRHVGATPLQARPGAEFLLRVDIDPFAPVGATLRRIAEDLALLQRNATSAARIDASRLFRIEETSEPDAYRPQSGTELTLVLSPDGTACRLVHDRAVVTDDAAAAMRDQFGAFMAQIQESPERPLCRVSLLSAEERRRMLVEWNDTAMRVPDDLCVHRAIEIQAARTPDAVAVVFRGEEMTYRQLDLRANRLARHLVSLGAGPDHMVGLLMERSLDMVVALLAILKAGAAYLPLDPAYPQERLDFMVADAGILVLLTQSRLASHLSTRAAVVCIDADAAAFAANAGDDFPTAVTPDHLAYVIYTSGSTGKPKGVMVSHRNVVNFFAAMDDRIPHDPPGVWLAVTSLSFDISVLEIFWTLARGFKVILHADAEQGDIAPADEAAPSTKPAEFSLFYFASDESEGVADRYRLLLEGAKFADRNGFAAVWSPERHFHAFGGLYPNPSVASAAIAAVTERVKIRAGSCVLPLHSPIRVAEEWALVDNLSGGRVGISFASGWQPNDFVIAPQNFAGRKEAMFRDIDVVRRLWRGEAIPFPGPDGKAVPIRTLPRPVQPELPVWITAAGNPETFRQAGEMGANLLTHLLGQSVADLGEKLAAYRRAWRESGHDGDGHVTLMLHSFVGEDDDAVREIVRKPMREYLRSSVDLIRRAAWTFPPLARLSADTGKSPGELFDAQDLSDAETDALLDHAFERYFESSGLFGTPDTCLRMVRKLQTIGVDEIACLIDFGVPSQQVLDHLVHLGALKDRADQLSDPSRLGILGEIPAYGVTHLQCTPSLARMLLADHHNRGALGGLDALMIGGEVFPASLAEQLRPFVGGVLMNMYGPTETTIWSTTHRISASDATIPLGRPIGNTQLYVLDGNLEPVPPDVPGELFIGGAGVARGYLNRPDLTNERFIPDPFDPTAPGRIYRTGDLVRYRRDGTLDILGRLDHQVKIRGHRIEVGEIETILCRQPGVHEAVAVAREEEPDLKRLVAYVEPRPGSVLELDHMRASLKAILPDYMVPAQIVLVDRMPLTPNGKIDRTALSKLRHAETVISDLVPPQDALEAAIAEIWSEALGRQQIGRSENFFDLGGDSLLAVVAHRKMCEALQQDLPVTDFFRFPTIAGLAQQIRVTRPSVEAPTSWSPLIAITPEGQARGAGEAVPLFIVHGLTGDVRNLQALALRLGREHPVYAVQARGLDGREPPVDCIEDMAASYLEHIRRVQPPGQPYRMAGFCFGGLVAFEMARQLSRVGETVVFLGLLDTAFHERFLSPFGRIRYTLAKQRIHAETISRLPLRESLAYLRSKVGARLEAMGALPVAAAFAGPDERSSWRIASPPAMLPRADASKVRAAPELSADLRAVTAAAEYAFNRYEPGTYSGKLTYFRPQQRDFRNIMNFARDWRDKASGGVETIFVPGDHGTMLNPPAVDVLAERLLACVKEGARASSS